MNRSLRLSASLLLATLAVSACSKGPVTGIAAVRAASGQVEAQARSEASKNLDSLMRAQPVKRADAGMPVEAFQVADQDRDGVLGQPEQQFLFRQVWDGMTAIAAAHQGPGDEQIEPSGVYKVPHTLEYTPAEAEVFIDATEIMPAVFQTLQSATQSIHMDLFLLGGVEGQKLAEILVAKAQAGVEVRIIHDPGYGLAGTAHRQIVPVMRYLLANGIDVKSYPLSYLQKRRGTPLANKFQIDHNKFIIVDRHTAMVGTMNLIDVGVMNHDVYVRVTGAAAEELAAIHDATWNLKGANTPAFPVEQPLPAITPPPLAKFNLLSNFGAGITTESRARVTKTDIDQQTTKKVVIDAFKSAKRSIHVAMFEFGDVDVANTLVEAYKRGVDVRVLTDKNANYGKYLDAFKNLNLYGTPNLVTMNLMREAGIPVKWYIPQTTDQELHMKLALVDGERVMVGSTNYTYQAFRTFRETNLDIVSPRVASRLELMFQRDWETRGTPVLKPTFYEKCIMAAVRSFDQFNLSWW